jgi:hypothetical protein
MLEYLIENIKGKQWHQFLQRKYNLDENIGKKNLKINESL